MHTIRRANTDPVRIQCFQSESIAARDSFTGKIFFATPRYDLYIIASGLCLRLPTTSPYITYGNAAQS
jgi:hypothetical protein